MALRDMFIIKEITNQEFNSSTLGQIAGEATDEIFNQFGLMDGAGADKMWTDMNADIQEALYSIVRKYVKNPALGDGDDDVLKGPFPPPTGGDTGAP